MIRIFMIGMSKEKGGVEAYISNLCSKLNKKYFEVVYCWPEMEINGKRWICPVNRHNYFKYRNFWACFFRENHFDVIYFNTCDIVSIDVLKFAKKANIQIRIIHSHSTNSQLKRNIFHRFTERWNRKHIKQYATNLFACSEDAGKWMFPKDSFVVIKNGINLDHYCYRDEYREDCRRMLGLHKEYLIGCISRLDKEKNPLKSVEIMSAITKNVPNAKGVFVGNGELKIQVEEKIKKIGLDDTIFLVGARNDANKWYSALDVLIMPSLFEGLPFTLIEAQAAGLPCVVSSSISKEANLTGLVEYVSLEESIEVWKNIILAAGKRERLDTTRQLVEAGYSIEDTVKSVSEILKEAL